MAYVFRKDKPWHKIWWVEDDEDVYDGVYLFTFDKIKIYSLFRDYPNALTSEEKAIFDKENPYWKRFFKERGL